MDELKDYAELTIFQWEVLKQTMKIPHGQTRTYKDVAIDSGSPKAVRAAGQALRHNPFPIIIPCHRVIRSDGTLGAYAGKYDKRKQELLNAEQKGA